MLSHLRKASALLYLILGYHLACIASPKLPMIWNIQNSNEYFVGRKSFLDQLKQSFIIDQKPMIAVVGSAGIGKTQVVKKYARNNMQYYDIVWWFDLEKSLDDQFKNLAENFNKINPIQELQVNVNSSPNEIVRQLKNNLALTKFKWLLVFDNVTDKSEIVDYLPEKLTKSYGHILITSKNQLSWYNMIKLEKFSREESIKLLMDITGEKDIASVNKLAETLTDYPLAIVQAASFIKSHPGQSIQEYRELFLNNRNKLWKYENKNKEKLIALDNYKFTVSTILSIIIEKLKKESPRAFDLLVFCSFLGSKNMPDSIIKNYAENILKIDALDYRNALSMLARYSLITQDTIEKNKARKATDNNDTTFTMHELTQAVAHNLLKTNEEKKYIEQCLMVMAEFLPTKLDILMPFIRQNSYLILHINTVYQHAKQRMIYNNNLFAVKQRLLEYYLSGKRDYKVAQKTINEIKDFISKINKPSSILEVRFFLMRSAFLAWQNIDHQKSLNGALHAFEMLKITTGYEEEYLMACNRLAQQYHLMGDNKNALKYAIFGEELARKNQSLGNQDALFSNFTKIHMDNGNFEEALKYSEKMIANLAHRRNRILPGPGNIPSYLIRCKVLIKAKKHQEAFKILSKIYRNLDNIFGTDDHIYKSTTKIYYAYVNFLIKNSTNPSKNIILDANKKLCQFFGESRKSLLLAQSYRFLGEIYESEGNHIEALNHFILALQAHYNHYKSEQIATDDISDLYTRLALINIKLKDSIASQQYLDLHRSIFSYNHPRTTIITEAMLDHGLAVRY